MDISVKDLQEAISIRQQIDNLQRRLSSLLRGEPQRPTAPRARGRYFSSARRKGQLTPAGRRKLSQLMKARWATRRKAGGTKRAPAKKRGALTAAGRKRLSDLMKARWAARRRAGAK